MPAPSPRVLLVDDHHLFRTGLRGMLEEEGLTVVDDVDGGEAAVERVRRGDVDVVLMDMHMPGPSGAEATPLVLEAAPGVRVLMLTVASDDATVLDAVRAGASGYLLKDTPLEGLVAGVHAAARGEAVLAPGVTRGVLASVREQAPAAAPASSPLAALTDRERDVLRLLTEGAENAEIARRLFLSPSTVKTYLSSIFAKLGVENRVQAAVLAIRLGVG